MSNPECIPLLVSATTIKILSLAPENIVVRVVKFRKKCIISVARETDKSIGFWWERQNEN
jgi:hypothetical protein